MTVLQQQVVLKLDFKFAKHKIGIQNTMKVKDDGFNSTKFEIPRLHSSTYQLLGN